jgi:hypothetical protein
MEDEDEIIRLYKMHRDNYKTMCDLVGGVCGYVDRDLIPRFKQDIRDNRDWASKFKQDIRDIYEIKIVCCI